MSYAYNTDYWPPAPTLEVWLALRDEAPRLGPLPAFVDTGADGTFVPTSWLHQLQAPAIDVVNVQGMFSAKQESIVYKIDLLIAGQRLPSVSVVGYAEEAEIIVGRNVLNKLILLLDGPRNMADILEQRPHSRA